MKLFSIIRRYSKLGTVTLAVLFGALSGLASTGLLLVINRTLFDDKAASEGRLLMWAFIALCAVVPLSRIASGFILVTLGQRTAYDLRIELGRRILAAPLKRLEEVGSHRLMVALTDDIASVTDALVEVPVIIINLALVIGCLVYLGSLSVPVLLAVLVFMAIGILSYQIPLVAGMRRQVLVREMADEMFAHFRGLTQGIKELKIHGGRRGDFLEHLKRTAGSVRDLGATARKIFITANTWGSLLFFVVVGLVLFAVPHLMSIDRMTMSGYVLVLLYLMTPLQLLLNAFPMLTQANIAVRKVESLGISLLEDGAEVMDSPPAAPAPAWRRLELRDVALTYRHDDEAHLFRLGPLDLTFVPGELVFIVGGNGSGKTTLAKLLLGLYEPEQGDILLDGEKLTPATLERYREHFSVVFSDYFLFEMLLGLQSPALEADANRYLAQLQLKHKVRVAGGRLSTTDLSSGQRKRLALLTAYLEDRPIYLFDEWAADQDPEFKKVFYDQLLPELKARGKTVLVISHDDRYYHVGDRIVKLDYGQLEYDQRVNETQYALA
ncbi:MAG: cyclic peptide export ABC transporter [Acidobacteriota bacterium]